MFSVYLSKRTGEKLLTLCMQGKGLTRKDTYSLENRKLSKENKRKDFERYGERVELCWEKTVQQGRRGEIVRGHKHHTALGHCTKRGYTSACVPSSEQGKTRELLPREYVG